MGLVVCGLYAQFGAFQYRTPAVIRVYVEGKLGFCGPNRHK